MLIRYSKAIQSKSHNQQILEYDIMDILIADSE